MPLPRMRKTFKLDLDYHTYGFDNGQSRDSYDALWPHELAKLQVSIS